MVFCCICGNPNTNGVHHFLYGWNRKNADQDGIYAPICDQCHTMAPYSIHRNGVAGELSKMFGQALWMMRYMDTEKSKEEALEAFMKRYGRNYIGDL